MNKKELAALMAESLSVSNKSSSVLLESILDVVTETLAGGEKVQVSGFGTFDVKKRAAKLARNPKRPTETMIVPPYTAAVFKAGTTMKSKINT